MQECVRLAAVLAYMEKTPLAIVFSQQEEFRGQAGPLWTLLKNGRFDGADRLDTFAMEDMRTVLPLQAADLVAYEILKAAPKFEHGGKLRVPVRVLLAIDPAAFAVNIDAGVLAQQVEGAKRILGLG
jgi:hypothetical protein